MKELEKNYTPHTVEDKIYKKWLDKGWFHAEVDYSRKPYTIVIPPPNITGQLHVGHALNTILQDILIRTKRMQGYNALWVPGTDHASISTEVRIVNSMAAEGLTKESIGRETFLKRAWQWRAEYGGRILQQFKKLGLSCDWERERFTMDEGLSRAVTEVFIRLYEKGLIYQGEKLINWCPKCRTTISDAEVSHEDMEGAFYHMKYRIKGTDECLQFATTRPETALGDTALAVNPLDGRYAKYVGQTVIVPIVNREIPVIADEYVDMDFGTGVVKITPAHDPNDFEVGERHNLPRVNIMNDDGTLNENAGELAGLDRYEARAEIIRRFKALGLFVREEKLNHAVGVHERCNEVVEPLVKVQWFVKMRDLAQPAMEVYKNGQLRIVPERFGKIYAHWLENIRDWCISRQLWWGHRIPAYYCERCGHVEVADAWPRPGSSGPECVKCGGSQFRQDEDTLDTWFSSALWPFSTLGWPDNTPELQYFYPTDVLVTAYEIIFFWVVRMVFSGLEQMGRPPFRDVLIHGIVRDAQGRKMSKSLDNGVDPLEIIEKYGADALRFTLVAGTALGSDSRFSEERVENNRNFLNKIWNAARFILMHLDEGSRTGGRGAPLQPEDKWILSRVNSVIKEVTDHIELYDLGMALQKVQDFIWDEFCDWYIEMVKPRLYNHEDPSRETALATLLDVLADALRLLHPFLPFITEEIFTSIQTEEETIMLSAWPQYRPERSFPQEEREIGLIKEVVKNIRNVRANMNVAPSRKVTLIIAIESGQTQLASAENLQAVFESGRMFLGMLAGAGEVAVRTDPEVPPASVPIVFPGGTVYIPLSDLVDIDKEIARLTKERGKLETELTRIDAKLASNGFIEKAPPAVIDGERQKREKYAAMLRQVQEQLAGMAK
ncbi:MAG: valine--tRNA ligase [Clostridiales bacterium]|jgi:valyl-tRNA synthetase|nr:valine--tRNA ligase [Clostridiales bacterium]